MFTRLKIRKWIVVMVILAMLVLEFPIRSGSSVASLAGMSSVSAATFNSGNGCFASPQKATLEIQTTTLTPFAVDSGVLITGTGFQAFVPVTLYKDAAVPLAGTDEGSAPISLEVRSDGTFTTTIPDSTGTYTASGMLGGIIINHGATPWVTTATVTNSNYVISAVDAGGNCAALTRITEGPGTALPDGTNAGIRFAGPFTGTLLAGRSDTFQSIGITVPITLTPNAPFTATIDASAHDNDRVVQSAPETLPGFTAATVMPVSPTVIYLNVPASLPGMNVHSLIITATEQSGGLAIGALGLRYMEPAPDLTISSASGPPFANITLNGVGFGGSTTDTSNAVTITGTAFSASGVAASSIPVPITDMSGTFQTTFPLTATAFTSGGTVVFTATDGTGASASTSFGITPLTMTSTNVFVTLISTNPCPPTSNTSTSAVAGQNTPVVLSGFAPDEPINLSVGGASPAIVGTTDPNGNLVVASVLLTTVGLNHTTPYHGLPGDEGIAGTTYLVAAVGQNSGDVATTYLTTCPSTLVTGPSAGQRSVGPQIAIDATNSTPAGSSAPTATPIFVIPPIPQPSSGPFPIYPPGTPVPTASPLPTSTPNPAPSPIVAGGSAIITGTGFSASAAVNLTDYVYTSGVTSTSSPGVVSANGTSNPDNVTTNATGSFTATVTLPITPGAYTIRAADTSGIVATTLIWDGLTPPTATPTNTPVPTATNPPAVVFPVGPFGGGSAASASTSTPTASPTPTPDPSATSSTTPTSSDTPLPTATATSSATAVPSSTPEIVQIIVSTVTPVLGQETPTISSTPGRSPAATSIPTRTALPVVVQTVGRSGGMLLAQLVLPAGPNARSTAGTQSLLVSLPAGAVSHPVTVTISLADPAMIRLAAGLDDNAPIGAAIDFDAVTSTGKSIHTFAAPLTVQFSYDPTLVHALGLDEKSLVIAFYDSASGLWTALPTTVDPVAHLLTARVTHFTPFQVRGAAHTTKQLEAALSRAVAAARATIAHQTMAVLSGNALARLHVQQGIPATLRGSAVLVTLLQGLVASGATGMIRVLASPASHLTVTYRWGKNRVTLKATADRNGYASVAVPILVAHSTRQHVQVVVVVSSGTMTSRATGSFTLIPLATLPALQAAHSAKGQPTTPRDKRTTQP